MNMNRNKWRKMNEYEQRRKLIKMIEWIRRGRNEEE